MSDGTRHAVLHVLPLTHPYLGSTTWSSLGAACEVKTRRRSCIHTHAYAFVRHEFSLNALLMSCMPQPLMHGFIAAGSGAAYQ